MALQILLVEDDPTVARLVRYCLEGQGHTVTTAEDGVTALSAAYASPPDLVLLDLVLPNLGGHLVCRALREDKRTLTVPVVLITGAGSVSEEVKGCGADGHLQKPFTPAQLLAAVAHFAEPPATMKGDQP